MIKMMQLKTYCFVSIFAFFSFISYPLETNYSKIVQDLIEQAFKQNSIEQTCSFLEVKAPYLQNIKDRLDVLKLLADYEETIGQYASAAKHYSDASLLATAEQAQLLQLKSASNYILYGNAEAAIKIIRNVEKNPISKDLNTMAKVYLVLIEAASSTKTERVVQQMRIMVTNEEYNYYHTMLLLALWWIDGDKTAKNTLQKRFPNSIETSIVNENSNITPTAFWYLMPRSNTQFEDFKESNIDDPIVNTANTISNAKQFQVGFYKTKAYADRQCEELKQKGFSAFVKKEIRKGEQYYSVIVPENNQGNICAKLKNAGYESSPIF